MLEACGHGSRLDIFEPDLEPIFPFAPLLVTFDESVKLVLCFDGYGLHSQSQPE